MRIPALIPLLCSLVGGVAAPLPPAPVWEGAPPAETLAAQPGQGMSGRAALAARDFEGAIQHARTSLGLLYFQPKGHYLLGLAHYRLGELAAAKDAFLTSVTMAPLFAAGFRMLGQIARFEHGLADRL